MAEALEDDLDERGARADFMRSELEQTQCRNQILAEDIQRQAEEMKALEADLKARVARMAALEKQIEQHAVRAKHFEQEAKKHSTPQKAFSPEKFYTPQGRVSNNVTPSKPPRTPTPCGLPLWAARLSTCAMRMTTRHGRRAQEEGRWYRMCYLLDVLSPLPVYQAALPSAVESGFSILGKTDDKTLLCETRNTQGRLKMDESGTKMDLVRS